MDQSGFLPHPANGDEQEPSESRQTLTAVLKSEQFNVDFAACALYLSERNPEAALRFIDAMDTALALLETHPEIGPVWRYVPPSKPTRYLLVPGFHNYLIFYRFISAQVILGRVLHGAQDLREIVID
jgi:plasmid stabilization system protein ParE